jgi:hypothetical protein
MVADGGRAPPGKPNRLPSSALSILFFSFPFSSTRHHEQPAAASEKSTRGKGMAPVRR